MNELQQVNEFLSVTGADFIRRVHELQDFLISQMPAEHHTEMPVKHHFAHKTYVREMFSPAGSIVIGKTHRYDHTCIVLTGRAIVYSEHGVKEISAPLTFHSERGAKRLFVVLEDLTLQTVHYAETDDLAAIEQDLIVPDSEVEQFRKDQNMEI